MLPAGCVSTHTVFCLRTPLPLARQHFLCGLFNSFVVNYLVRLRVTTHVTTATVERLPIPTADARRRRARDRLWELAVAPACCRHMRRDAQADQVIHDEAVEQTAQEVLVARAGAASAGRRRCVSTRSWRQDRGDQRRRLVALATSRYASRGRSWRRIAAAAGVGGADAARD